MVFINKCVIAIVLTLFAFSAMATAGGNAGDFGIGLSAVESSPKFMIRWWINDQFTFEPTFGIIHVDPSKKSSATRYLPGFGFVFHFRSGEELRPFIGSRFDLDISSGGKTYFDLIIALPFGAEYFFSDKFSVSGEYQLQLIITDSEASSSISLLADTFYVLSKQMLAVHFYF